VSATRTTFLAVAVIALTFTAGVAVGVFTDHMMIVRRGGRLDHMPFAAHLMTSRLDHHLDLTGAQKKQIEQILSRRRVEMDAIFATMKPRVDATIDRTNAEIEQVLTPEQRKKFARLKMRAHGPVHRGLH
jgi:Spy/CpxP family protein refolding chaperone